MADNLSVAVTADTSQLRAQLALAQADLKAFGAETRKLAQDIRSGGDAVGVLRGQLEQVAGQFGAAKSNVIDLTAASRDHKGAHEEATTGIKGVNEALQGMRAPINNVVGGFREMAEVAGVAFAAEKLAEFAKEMAELGKKNMIAANGTGGGAGAIVHNWNIAAVDAAGVAKFLRANGPALVAALNAATRNGAMLRTS